ncbi:outer envelope pore protein 37, chloroplastic isoform X2 [Physcomitrium patens]|uniref:Outer envelope pore protein 37, chloroplastic n=2 Tax=Physcomitrium patens TaxID=3218 RepID=A0A2K1ICQ5_PHYPA|nr:outer envelope pore protein 37, chloroplastic-like isoform X2 [Physcomitrium patens]XP_024366642.1 outer envelope pore protein 37, chloroplastic-like isoform X2 [Physcomitrium patens]PNR27046.1 hypothetical protein PHYPA_030527 [Physcomitrium patens]|eukprot:XP_024366641.1 outer envelope pore protein 37, chloroplastic-like isoform X2 [Physcomitrella patens]
MGGAAQVRMPEGQWDWRQMAAVKMSTEYDSEGSVFVNKMSARVLNGLAKLTGSFQREPSGDLRYPLMGVVTKYLSVMYDHEDRNALVTFNADVGRNLSVKYLRDIKAQQGELKLQAHTSNLRYKTEISSDVPATTLPKVVFTFPVGQLRAEEVEKDEERAIALSGFFGGSVLNGQAVASYSDESATLKYTYKDEELTLVPSVSWPRLSPSLAFKRQFGPRNKLSYFHNFETTTWSAVYKYKPTEDFKVKLGYDSDVRLCWSSFWVGKEDEGAKNAPRKCKLQVMLQVPQDDVKSGALLFRMKKRWDLF